MRQSGVCHLFNTETRQTVFLLFSPKPNSKGHKAIEEYLSNRTFDSARTGLVAMHEVFFAAHLPAWRQYVVTQEAEFLPIVSPNYSLIMGCDD